MNTSRNHSRSSPGGLRGWFNDHPAASFALVIALVASAVALAWLRGGGGLAAGPNDVYYFDLATGKLFAAPDSQITPIAAPSGSDVGVRAFVYACQNCDDKDDRFVAYLQWHNPRVLERIAKNQHGSGASSLAMKLLFFNESPDGYLVHTPDADADSLDPSQWVVRHAPAAAPILTSARGRCGAEVRPMRCDP